MPAAGEAGALPWVLDAENPWPGLESFRERDQPFFRGRNDEAERLRRMVDRERLTVLFGPSGLGKSSLLQAGLFPRVRNELMLPVHIRLQHDDQAPGLREQVLAAIAAEAEAHGIDHPPPQTGETLWEYFHRERNAFWTADNEQVIPLLVFDQFEEAFTLGAETRARELRTAAFLEELGDLVEGRPSTALRRRMNEGQANPRDYLQDRHDYKVLLVIREDFLAQLETLRSSVPSVMSNRMPLAPLHGKAALLVTAAGGTRLVPPSTVKGEESVGEQIVRLVAGTRGEDRSIPLDKLRVDPALLSLFCRELNERRKEEGLRSITPDLVKGNREKILAGYYTRSIGDLGPALRKFVEEKLVTVNGHRNSEDYDNAVAEKGITPEALNTLIARRLIRREERDARVRIELTHDVLTEVVRQSRDQRRAAEEAEAHAEQALREAEAEAERERQRAERARMEAEARAERARLEAEALAERAERARLETEARAERARLEAETLAERAERARIEADARAERARLEAETLAERAERARIEADARAERVRMEAEAQAALQRERAEQFEREAALAASAAAEARRQARNLRVAAGAVLVFAVVAVVLAVIANNSRLEARAAEEGALAATDSAKIARDEAVAASARELRARDSIALALTATEAMRDTAVASKLLLQVTNDSLLAAKTEVDRKELLARVEREAADQYLTLGSRLRSYQTMQEQLTDSIQGELRQALQDAQSAAASAEDQQRRLAMLESMLCRQDQKRDEATDTARAYTLVRQQVNRELSTRRQNPLRCGSEAGSGAAATRGANGP